VGEAMLRSGTYPEGIAGTWGVGNNAPKDVRQTEFPLERDVSKFVGQMPFLWIEIPDAPSVDSDRAYLERNCIALLSNFGKHVIDAPSPNWLGLKSGERTIRESGLWNTNHVDGTYSDDFLDRLREYVPGPSLTGSDNLGQQESVGTPPSAETARPTQIKAVSGFTSDVRLLSQPLTEGLRVRHIAHFGLIGCDVADDAGKVLARPELADYDQIPVRDCTRIVGVLERISGERKPLNEDILVSADEALASFICTLRHQAYRLVVDGTSITGIVTWSDLLKLPVFLLAYSLIAQLELLMNKVIARHYRDSDDWLQLLDEKEVNAIESNRGIYRNQNLFLPTVELADFKHKAKAVRQFLSGCNFEGDLKNLGRLRIAVAHVHRVVRSNAELHAFIDSIETATKWINVLEQADTQPSAMDSDA
jgi:hypothetical protein